MHPATININYQPASTYAINMEVNSQTPNLDTYRKIFGCSACLIIFGLFFLLSGSIITASSYDPQFSDPFFTRNNPFRKVGPTMLAFGILFIITSIIIFCIAKISKKWVLTQRNSAPSAPPPPPYPPVDFRPQMLQDDASRPSYVLPIERPGAINDQPPCYRCVMQNVKSSECIHSNYGTC